VEQSGEEITAIYLRNIFPDIRITSGTHPNNIGHTDSADEDNSKILKELGMK
jgi:hypothetical protein